MKIKIKSIVNRAGTKSTAVLALSIVACSFGLTACAQIKSWVTKPGAVEQLRPAATNFVTTVITNTVVIPAETNTVTGEITPASLSVQVSTNLTPVIQPAVYFTNLDLADIAQNGITTADTAASAVGIPWAHTAAEGLLAVIGGLLSWTNFRNRQKLLSETSNHSATQSALGESQAVAKTLVQNFEQLRRVALTIPGYTRQIDDKVMTAIQIAQQLAGVKDQINTLVDSNTNTTIPGN